MRIAYLTSQYPAPSHTFIRREIEALRKKGVDIITFSIRRPETNEVLSETDRTEVEQTWYVLRQDPLTIARAHLSGAVRRPGAYVGTLVDSLRHRVPGARSLLWSVFYFGEAIALAHELEDRGVTHLHNHFANAAANVGMLASRFLGIPWSMTLHGISEFDYPAGQTLPAKLRAAKFVACVSHFGRAQASRIVEPIHWSKMMISRCGIDVGTLPTRRLREVSSRLRIVCVGRLSPEKGHSGLLEAFAMLVTRGVDAELRLVGEGPEHERLASEIERRGLKDRVLLTGRASESGALQEVANADIFVLASFMEGLPVVLMEALSLKVPVIAPCVAGIPELVQDGVTGLLFSPSNWAQLADVMEEYCRDPGMRAKHAEAGHRRVFDEFVIERAVDPMLRAFKGQPAALDENSRPALTEKIAFNNHR